RRHTRCLSDWSSDVCSSDLVPEVDAAVDCVGFEARGHGKDSKTEQPATVLNSIMEITRAGGALGIPGLYVTDDPGGVDANAKSRSEERRVGRACVGVVSTGP